ncbi:MAG: TonB-dependent receptor [Spirochaetaceae bacterium]|jgi:iron complex outermembrane receptor protein|nr:TonB-dependent receptor [Spirochaetaceae bacterium]
MKKFILVMTACFGLQAAFAQDAAFTEPESEGSLDFVVTAGRTREEAAKVSAQVTVITAEDIAESGATSVTDLLNTVPGMSLNRDDTGAGYSVSARGFSSLDGRKKVLILVDGMRLNTLEGKTQMAWDVINLSEIERIEVLDGGASVQYGDNAQAGVINIITKKSGDAKTDITVSGGSFFQNEQRFSHHRPMDWGGFTVSGGHRGTQGYQKHSGFDTGNGELRGFWDLNDSMSLNANMGFAFTNYLFAMSLTKKEFDDDPTQNARLTTDDGSSMNINAGLNWNWAINETMSFDLPLSYIWQSVRYNDPTMLIGMTPQMFNMRPKITAELLPGGMGLRIIGGVDMLLAFNETKASMDTVKGTNPNRQTADEFSIAPYALVNFEPLSILSLNAGLRYDAAFVNGKAHKWETTMMVDMNDDGVPETPYPMSYPSDSKSTDWGAFVYEAGLTVNPFDFLKVYAKYGTQFRYPYLDEIMSIDYIAFQYTMKTDIEPEKGWTVEGGIGLNYGGIVRLDGNYYYIRTDNEITSRLSTAGGMVLDYYNADPIERTGTNIGVTLTPGKYVELELDYGFVNAVFSDGPHKDKFVPQVAKQTLSAVLMLHTAFGLSFGPTALYKTDYYAFYDDDNSFDPVEGYFILGLKARYVRNIRNGGELALMVTAHNLLDTYYATLAYAPTTWSGTETTYFIDSNMGRSVNVSLQYRF